MQQLTEANSHFGSTAAYSEFPRISAVLLNSGLKFARICAARGAQKWALHDSVEHHRLFPIRQHRLDGDVAN
jgi:hypothetical protein